MKLYATTENEGGKKKGVGGDKRLAFEIRIGNRKFAEGELEAQSEGYYLYFSTTLGNIDKGGYEDIEDQCVDYFIPYRDLQKGKKQKDECQNKDANGNACWDCESGLGNGISDCGTTKDE